MKSLRWQGAPAPNNDALSHAVAMVLAILFFGFLGSLVDGLVGTGPIFLLLFGALGVVGAFTSAHYRYEIRMAQHDAGKPWMRRQQAASASASGEDAGR